jgi:hypothetical protein
MASYNYNATTKRMEADRSIQALRDKIKYRHTLRSFEDRDVDVDEGYNKVISTAEAGWNKVGTLEVHDEHATCEDYNKLISTIEALTYHYFNQKRI